MNSKLTQQIRVFGRVQGVGFRNWAVATAQSFNITGWVRNRKDGSVEIIASGQPGEIRRFIEACHKGPSTATVEAVSVQDAIDEEFTAFEQRKTY